MPHPSLGTVYFPPAGLQSQFLVSYSCALSSDPSNAFAPGSVTNDAFVCRCNNHRAANIKQDRCSHHKTNQWPQGDLVASPSFFLISSDAQPHQAPVTPPGGQLAEQDQRELSARCFFYDDSTAQQ